MDLTEEISLFLSEGLLCTISLFKEEFSMEFAKRGNECIEGKSR